MSEEILEHKTDRTGWPKGPWDGEPDRVDFISHGLSCLLLRGPVGSWCGYVGVPEEHPAFGKDYEHIDVNIHGGLTYAAECRGHICHKPEPGMPEKVWWLGFDTAHCGDLSPGMLRHFNGFDSDTYKDVKYVEQETLELAEQLAEMMSA